MRFWSGKRVLVAGGAGFVGTALVGDLVRAGAVVTVVDDFRTGKHDAVGGLGVRVIEHDVIAPLPAGTGSQDVVFNLACAASPAKYQADPIGTWRSSVYGTDNLLTHALAQGARFVQCSTSEVYGDPDVSPQRETYNGNVALRGARACYDEGKRAAEVLVFDTVRKTGADARIARLFNTYGPGMRPNDGRVMPNFVAQALAGAALTVYGDGRQTRSFCHISDTVRGIMRLVEVDGLAGEVVNIGSDQECSILELATLVADLAGVPLELVHQDLPEHDPKIRRPDLSRARALLGWRPQVALRDGVAAMLRAHAAPVVTADQNSPLAPPGARL